jgi:hypothetical protein
MSGFNYDSLRISVAEKQIKRFGKIAQIVTPGAATGPKYNPSFLPPTKEPVYFLETRYSMTDRNQTLVEVGDKMGLVSTETGAIPQKSINQIEIDDVLYQFIDVQPLNPGGVVMLYKVHCRK